MPIENPQDRLTLLFERWRRGDEAALDEIVPELYAGLRRQAAAYLSRERAGHTLQPTELVHEAFVRLIGGDTKATDRNHFFALAARVMRRVLVDHARHYQAERRFSPAERLTLATDVFELPGAPSVDVLDLHLALERLSRISERGARVVEMRYFGGLTLHEVADVLEVGRTTVDREWKTARLWLKRELAA